MSYHPSVTTLQELVRINSVNPAFEGPGEGAYADYLEERCKKNNIKTTRVPVAEGRDNLLMEARTGHKDNVLLFESHMDVVSVKDMDAPFDPVIEDGKMKGRGSCDTKATMAGMLYALEYAAAHPDEFECDVVLAATIDEEHDFIGALHLGRNLDMIDGKVTGAVIGEPTEKQIVIAHKGVCRFIIRVKGVAAHTAVAHRGVNAISQMRKVLSFLEDDYFPRRNKTSHPLCGNASGVVSMINGGVQINMVPPSCEIQVDLRVLPGDNSARLLESIKEELSQKFDGDDISYEIETLLLDTPLDTDPNSNIAQSAAQTAKQLGIKPDFVGKPYGTDASKLEDQGGLEGIVFGPGTIDVAHTPHEHIEITEVEEAAEFYLQMAKNYKS